MTRHPLNCGTCKYPHTSSCEYWKRVSDGLYEIKTETIWLEASVATVGCASHSNIINQQDDPCIECIHIKKEIQDAREKVLDELIRWGMADGEKEMIAPWVLIKKLESLRLRAGAAMTQAELNEMPCVGNICCREYLKEWVKKEYGTSKGDVKIA